MSTDNVVSVESLLSGYDLNRRLGYLSVEEVLKSVDETRRRHPELQLVFIEVNCYEPTKEELVQSVISNRPLPRRSEVVTQSLELNQTLIDIILLSDEHPSVPDYPTEVLQDVQAGLSPDEYIFVEKVCKSYQPLLDAIAARGLDPAGLVADAWCCGHTGPDCDPTERICWPSLFYCTEGDDDIPYGRPIEGIGKLRGLFAIVSIILIAYLIHYYHAH
jgi:Cu2+-containing amine oxidase